MKQIIFLLLFISSGLFAQTGIGTTTPNASAKLDVSSTNKGFLPPRISLIDAYDQTTIPSPATGLLVYCKGDAGLAAGYYFWNGNAWATIATAGGSGSVAAEFGTEVLAANVGITSSSAVDVLSFTIPTAGTWELIYFLRAQGAPGFAGECAIFDPAGMVVPNSEVIAAFGENASTGTGIVRITTTGGGTYKLKAWASSGTFNATSDNNGRTAITWKKISGNAPVTGQSVDYIQASLSASQTYTAVGNINFNTSSGAGITITSGGFNLIANKTYKLEAAVGGASGGYAYYGWVDNSNNLLPGGSIGAVMKAGQAFSDAPQDKAVVFFTPTVDTRVFLRVYNLSGTLTAYAPSLSTNFASTWASIQQVGSSAIVNPWILSGTDTYNTTGKVGIGTNAPTQALDVIGNVKASGSIIGAAAGSTIKTTILSSSELASGSSTLINSATATTIATYSYTPISNSSYIIIEYNTSYRISGYGQDTFASQIAVEGTLISKGLQDFTGSSSGGGTRSSVLFPLVARYPNSSTTPIGITVKANRNSADDSITVYNDTSTWMKITEIAR